MNKWDVYIADVPFEDIQQSKIRPVIVLEDNVILVLCIKLTTHSPHRGEYQLAYWKEAGLSQPTTVRIQKILSLDKTNFKKKIGKVSDYDIIQIQKLIEK